MENFNCLINIYNYYYVSVPAEACVEEVPEAAAEPEPEAAPAPEEEEPIPELEAIEDEDESNGWDTESEDLVHDAEVAQERWDRLVMEEAEAQAAAVRAREEANLLETELKEAEDDYNRKHKHALKRIEEKKKEKLDKKKRKLN